MLPHEVETRMSFYEAVMRDGHSVSSTANSAKCSSYSFNNGLTTYYYNGDKESYTDTHGRVWTKMATEYLPYPEPDKTLRSLELANQLDAFMLMREFEGILHVPLIYRKLFHRTRQYTTSVKCLIDATISYNPSRWAEAACLLVDWSVDILRHPAVGFERFLHSQRESIYWIMDDTLLKACLDQWDMPSSNTPWDKITLPLRNALARAESKLPEWAAAEYAELQKWGSYGEVARDTESGYFRRSRNFLRHSNRIHELWRTMKLCAKGQLPTELARVVVEHVSEHEKLPLGELRPLYLPRDKGKKLPATDYRGYGPDPFGETADIMIERIRGFAL